MATVFRDNIGPTEQRLLHAKGKAKLHETYRASLLDDNNKYRDSSERIKAINGQDEISSRLMRNAGLIGSDSKLSYSSSTQRTILPIDGRVRST
jgi:hypothetical protein